MTLDRAKPLMLPIGALLAFEGWARATHLQSDSLAPPSEIVVALAGALAVEPQQVVLGQAEAADGWFGL